MINFQNVESLHATPESLTVFMKQEAPIVIQADTNRSQFMTKYRQFKNGLPSPCDRVIRGIDDLNAAGVYSRDAELKHIRNSLTLKEKRTYHELTDETLNVLSSISSMQSYSKASQKALAGYFEAVVTNLKENQGAFSSDPESIRAIEQIKNIIQDIKKISQIHKSIDNAMLSIMEPYFKEGENHEHTKNRQADEHFNRIHEGHGD